ncbi:hypothetical protein ACFY41_16920 [Streptomyces syringium]|uniref:hypothetical protein n=1 Tax=Streptomyces syringium TaxID=76729 RepID=UPI00367FECB8
MLNPINAEAVIRDGQVSGVFPDEIHEGVAWWVASCFVVVSQTQSLAVARDDHPITAEFFRRFCRGAVNAQHWACAVHDLGLAEERQLLRAMHELGAVPGALLTTAEHEEQRSVTIRLYGSDGRRFSDSTGLGVIREMIANDHVPIPVNNGAKGHVEERHYVIARMEATK